VKHGEDPQEGQTGQGMKPSDKGYGAESPAIYGQLTTNKQFHDDQKEVTALGGNKVYEGRFPSLTGSYVDYYEDVVKAIRGEAPVVIKPEHARDGLRIIELGRESADLGKTLPMD
jgi:predicted dehydrogenase